MQQQQLTPITAIPKRKDTNWTIHVISILNGAHGCD